MDESPQSVQPSIWKPVQHFLTIILVGILAFWVIAYTVFWRAPSDFPTSTIVTIESGQGLQRIVQDFKSKSIIRSPFMFRSLVIILGGEKRVVAGDYLLDTKENPLTLALRIIRGDFHMNEIKLTIPEGMSVKEIGELLDKNLVSFDQASFVERATSKEGYLFPDTYFFRPTTKPEDVIGRMNALYEKKIETLQKDILASKHSEKEIITMASILEGEAKTTEDRKIVSGILWKRMSAGIPLQVDATFKYINGKGTAELSLDDLKIDSRYNTYVYRGLPPTPINNPGLDAILASLYPTKTPYLYFLTGRDGKMYYARTFEEHKVNKAKYLR